MSPPLRKRIKDCVVWHDDYRNISRSISRVNRVSPLLELHRTGHTWKYVLLVTSVLETSGDQIEG